jgi:hypothetical protein
VSRATGVYFHDADDVGHVAYVHSLSVPAFSHNRLPQKKVTEVNFGAGNFCSNSEPKILTKFSVVIIQFMSNVIIF